MQWVIRACGIDRRMLCWKKERRSTNQILARLLPMYWWIYPCNSERLVCQGRVTQSCSNNKTKKCNLINTHTKLFLSVFSHLLPGVEAYVLQEHNITGAHGGNAFLHLITDTVIHLDHLNTPSTQQNIKLSSNCWTVESKPWILSVVCLHFPSMNMMFSSGMSNPPPPSLFRFSGQNTSVTSFTVT